MDTWAYVLAVLSAFANATFFAPNRLKSVTDANLDPLVYNFYTTIGVFVFSWIVAAFLPLVGVPVFTLIPAGFVAGGLFTLALCFSCLALPLLGLSVAMGVWCGTAILVSFLWGTIGPPAIARPLASVPLSVAAVALIILGVLGIINVDDLGHLVFSKFGGDKWSRLQTAPSSTSETDAKSKTLGIFYAISVGCFGGSMLAPLSFIPAEVRAAPTPPPASSSPSPATAPPLSARPSMNTRAMLKPLACMASKARPYLEKLAPGANVEWYRAFGSSRM